MQHIVVVTQYDPHMFWSQDQKQNYGVTVPFPTFPYTPRFDVVRGIFRRNSGGLSVKSEPNVVAQLETTFSLGKGVTCVYPAWQCPNHIKHVRSFFICIMSYLVKMNYLKRHFYPSTNSNTTLCIKKCKDDLQIHLFLFVIIYNDSFLHS